MNAADLTRRIYDNLNWPPAGGPNHAPGETARPADVWSQVRALWTARDREFVEGLYLALLSRPVDRAGLARSCEALAGGMPRANFVRSLARSDEARRYRLDLSWLPKLDALPAGRPGALGSLAAFFRRWAGAGPRAVWSKVTGRALRRFRRGDGSVP
jgi:Domain of unknown function (DUF4214)